MLLEAMLPHLGAMLGYVGLPRNQVPAKLRKTIEDFDF